MPNVATVLKEEIARVARKEIKAAIAPIRKPSVRVRHDVASLKQRVAVMEKANKGLQARLAKLEAAQPAAPAADQAAKGWISGRGVRSLRKRLGLSQGDFARLVGVSAQAVYMWESKPGTLELRGATKGKLFAVRGIGAREAKARLAEMPKAVKPKKVAKRAAAKRSKAKRRGR